MKVNRFLMLVAAMVMAGAWSACSSSSSSSDMPDTVTDAPMDVPGDPGMDPGMDVPTDPGTDPGADVPPTKARLRVMHLSPDAPEVDVFANGGATAAVKALAFPDGTRYLDLDPGTYTFAVAPKDAGIGAKVLEFTDVALEAGTSYTAVAYDLLASIKGMALVDDYAGLDAGKIRIRAVHVAAGIGVVDILNVAADGTASALISDLAYGAASAALDIPAGTYKVGVDLNNDGTPEVVFQLPPLPAGIVATAYAVKSGADVFLVAELADGTTVRIDPVPPPAKAHLRAIHLSPDAPAVDIFANGGATAAVTNLAFPTGTAYLDLDAGTYTFAVSATGTGIGAKVLELTDVVLESDVSYTVVAYDLVAALKGMALVDKTSTLGAGSIRVRAVHVAAGVGQVDILSIASDGTPSGLIADLDYAEASAALDIPAGTYKIGIDVDNNGTPEVAFQLPALAAGTMVTAFAVKSGADIFLIGQFADGTTARIDPAM